MAGVDSPTPAHSPVLKPHQAKQPAACLPNTLHKAFFLLVLLFLLPLFPPQAPEFLNQTVLTRGWELLHLLLVGIAVSYGLFSSSTADQVGEKEPAAYCCKSADRSFASQLLEVPPVFDDDEAGDPLGQLERRSSNKAHQMWSSRYQGDSEATVVVAPRDILAESTAEISESEPLYFLPLRRLISMGSSSDRLTVEEFDEIVDGSSEYSRARSRSDSLGRTGTGRLGDGGRYGRLQSDGTGEEEEEAVLPSLIPWRSRSERNHVKTEPVKRPIASSPFSVPSSPETEADARVSRTPSFRSRPLGKLSASPPPPPPPPPTSLFPYTSEVRSKNIDDVMKKKKNKRSYKSSPSPPPPPPPLPPQHFYPYRSQYVSDNNSRVTRSFKQELKDMCRTGEEREAARKQSFSSSTEEKPSDEQPPRRAAAPAFKTVAEKKIVQTRKFIIDSEDDASDSDVPDNPAGADKENGELGDEGEGTSSSAEVEDDGNEVDKKADEFIAKFREQIRLQRIESIKRSAGQKRAVKNQVP